MSEFNTRLAAFFHSFRASYNCDIVSLIIGRDSASIREVTIVFPTCIYRLVVLSQRANKIFDKRGRLFARFLSRRQSFVVTLSIFLSRASEKYTVVSFYLGFLQRDESTHEFVLYRAYVMRHLAACNGSDETIRIFISCAWSSLGGSRPLMFSRKYWNKRKCARENGKLSRAPRFFDFNYMNLDGYCRYFR